MIDVGLLHQLEELAGIGAERFDVAALPLRIDGVEGEARLAAAGEAGDHRERVAGMSIETSLRLCSRAPRTEMWVRGMA